MILLLNHTKVPRVFLTAEWRHLVMLNYVVEPALLERYVPRGTELDKWNGNTYVSIVGFLFNKTRIKGVPIPFHSSFEELNLRFYVRRQAEDGWRRGVVFIRELVPKRMVAFVARSVYNEKYSYAPMSHEINRDANGQVTDLRFDWKYRGTPSHLSVALANAPQPLHDGSEEEFIAEHYWGYAAQRDGGTMEYRVAHPRWSVATATDVSFACDIETLYGPEFVTPLTREPSSAFYATGSAVEVYDGVRIED